jgi:hypothetical protein
VCRRLWAVLGREVTSEKLARIRNEMASAAPGQSFNPDTLSGRSSPPLRFAFHVPAPYSQVSYRKWRAGDDRRRCRYWY